jgi:hypothetical protein
MFVASSAGAKRKQAVRVRFFVGVALMSVIVCRRHGAVLAPAHQKTFARELRRALHRYGRGSPVPGLARLRRPVMRLSLRLRRSNGLTAQAPPSNFAAKIVPGEYCL